MRVIGDLSDLDSVDLTVEKPVTTTLDTLRSSETFTELKAAVLEVADAGKVAVSTVRDSFGAGVAPFTTVGSGSVANYLDTFVSSPLGSKIVKDTSRLGLLTAPGGGTTPPPRPELDSVSVVEDRHRGMLDQFTTHLTISIPRADASRLDRIRVFRAYVGRASVPRPGFAALMDAPVVFNKGVDPLLPAAMRAAELGVGNQVTTFISQNPGAASLSVVSPAERVLPPALPTLNTNRGTEMVSTGLLSIDGDRSVVENLAFYLNRRAVGDVPEPVRPPLSPGSVSGINVLRGSRVSTVGSLVQVGNSLDFSSIGDTTPHGPSVRTVGDIVEITFVDPSVVFGAIYSYYVAAVGQHGDLGPRSRLIEVAVARTVPPRAPTVTYGLCAGVPRFSIRCPQGTSHVEVFRSGRAALLSTTMGSDESLIVEGPSNKVGEFYHAGDLGLGPDGSTTFIDNDIVPGDRPTYRFYSVDPYGLKSQTPFSCSFMIPAHGEKLPLAIPSITSEQVTRGGNVIRVSVTCDDPRIVGFMFSRRDVTLNERAVHQANQPEYVTHGRTDAKRAGSRRGPVAQDLSWPSVLMATAGSASFTDTSVRLDRIYQYAVQGVDRRGNKTFLVGAPPVGVYSKPTIDAPTDLTAAVVVEQNTPTGVLLTWTPGTVDFSPNHLLDDQDVLAATAVRSVFQVERRLKGAPFWDAMPATTESYFIDPSIDDKLPSSRPPYVVKGSEYEYRVLAMQSGGFVSPRTDVVSVTVAPAPLQPETVWVRTTNLTVRPLNVVVSWDMPSTFIHRWEVQRAVTNKIYGSRIGSMDSKLARALEYQTVAMVTPEASRALGLHADNSVVLDKSIYVGGRFFVDADIDPSNSYFYRVRAVGALGVASEWTYGGVSISDYTFDRKFLSTLSDDEKLSLVTDPRPIATKLAPITSTTSVLIGRFEP